MPTEEAAPKRFTINWEPCDGDRIRIELDGLKDADVDSAKFAIAWYGDDQATGQPSITKLPETVSKNDKRKPPALELNELKFLMPISSSGPSASAGAKPYLVLTDDDGAVTARSERAIDINDFFKSPVSGPPDGTAGGSSVNQRGRHLLCVTFGSGKVRLDLRGVASAGLTDIRDLTLRNSDDESVKPTIHGAIAFVDNFRVAKLRNRLRYKLTTQTDVVMEGTITVLRIPRWTPLFMVLLLFLLIGFLTLQTVQLALATPNVDVQVDPGGLPSRTCLDKFLAFKRSRITAKSPDPKPVGLDIRIEPVTSPRPDCKKKELVVNAGQHVTPNRYEGKLKSTLFWASRSGDLKITVGKPLVLKAADQGGSAGFCIANGTTKGFPLAKNSTIKPKGNLVE